MMERVQLMYDSKQIDSSTYRELPGLLLLIEETYGIKLCEDNAGAMVAHLAKAIQRIREGAPVQELSAAVEASLEELQAQYEFALRLLSPYNVGHADLKAEAAYMAAYFAMLTDEEE